MNAGQNEHSSAKGAITHSTSTSSNSSSRSMEVASYPVINICPISPVSKLTGQKKSLRSCSSISSTNSVPSPQKQTNDEVIFNISSTCATLSFSLFHFPCASLPYQKQDYFLDTFIG